MARFNNEQYENVKAYFGMQNHIDEVIYSLENSLGDRKSLLAQAENIRMNLDVISRYREIDDNNLSNILNRLEKLNNILNIKNDSDCNDLVEIEIKDDNIVNLKKKSNEIIDGTNPFKYYIANNSLVSKFAIILFMILMPILLNKFSTISDMSTVSTLGSSISIVGELMMTTIKLISTLIVSLLAITTTLDIIYIALPEFREMMDNIGKNGLSIISAEAKIAVMQENGYTEEAKLKLIQETYKVQAMEDKQNGSN